MARPDPRPLKRADLRGVKNLLGARPSPNTLFIKDSIERNLRKNLASFGDGNNPEANVGIMHSRKNSERKSQ